VGLSAPGVSLVADAVVKPEFGPDIRRAAEVARVRPDFGPDLRPRRCRSGTKTGS